MDNSAIDEDFIPDQADVEANREAELRAKSELLVTHVVACYIVLGVSVCLSYDNL